MVKGYSRVQILLHWLIAVLIVLQIIGHEPMVAAWDAVRKGAVPDMSVMVWGHIIGGTVVLLLVLWRMGLRMTRGAPPVPQGNPLIMLAGKAGHLGLYALMVLVPASGLAAWFGGVEAAAEAHELMKNLLILLVLVHVAAALYHQFYLKDGLLARMGKAED